MSKKNKKKKKLKKFVSAPIEIDLKVEESVIESDKLSNKLKGLSETFTKVKVENDKISQELKEIEEFRKNRRVEKKDFFPINSPKNSFEKINPFEILGFNKEKAQQVATDFLSDKLKGVFGDKINQDEVRSAIKELFQEKGIRDRIQGFPRNEFDLSVHESLSLVEKRGQKFSQKAAKYIPFTLEAHKTCGSCRFFMRLPKGQKGFCQVVEKPVNWFGHSDFFIDSTEEAQAVFSNMTPEEKQARETNSVKVHKDFDFEGFRFREILKFLKLDSKKEKENQKGSLVELSPESESDWNDGWSFAVPLKGKPLKFAVQVEFRDLTEEQSTMNLEELLETDKPFHFDLRFESDRMNGFFGITAFAGKAEDNKPELKIFQTQNSPSMKLLSIPKPFGVKRWLNVGFSEPLVVEVHTSRGEPRFSKFFGVDSGTYLLGFAHKESLEIFLNGEILKGRFIWKKTLDETGKPLWFFSRPKEQETDAKRESPDNVASLVADSGNKFLVWPVDPLDLFKGHDKLDVEKVLKSDSRLFFLEKKQEKKYTLAVAYPANEVDTQGDFIDSDELEKAAWKYLEKGAEVGVMHSPGTEGAGKVVESYIYRGPDWKLEKQTIQKGDWLVGIIWNETVWEKIKNGSFTGVSFQGESLKEAAKKPPKK